METRDDGDVAGAIHDGDADQQPVDTHDDGCDRDDYGEPVLGTQREQRQFPTHQ